MNLLFISESFPTSAAADFTGGVEARDFYIARELAKKHHVTIITNARPHVPSRQILAHIHVIRCGFPVSSRFRNNPLSRPVFILSSIITSLPLQFDIVQGSNIFSQFPAFIIGLIHRRPKVALIHDVFINYWYQNTDIVTATFGEILERLVLRLPWNLIITNSHTTTTKLHHAGFNPPRHLIIPGGVDLTLCHAIKTTKASAPTIIYAGRLVGYKHLDDLIAAISQIKLKIPNIKLKIIGAGPEFPRLKRQVQSLRLNRHIKFLGFIRNHRQVITYIKSSHLFCLPSTVEGFGLVTLEAAASGIPFVNSSIPATLEVTKDGRGGLLFKPRDVSDLSRQIIHILTNKKLYHQKVIEAGQLAKTADWSIIARDTVTAFKQIIDQHQ